MEYEFCFKNFYYFFYYLLKRFIIVGIFYVRGWLRFEIKNENVINDYLLVINYYDQSSLFFRLRVSIKKRNYILEYFFDGNEVVYYLIIRVYVK